MARKPNAADRTVDMLTGQTKAEVAAAALEDVQEAPKVAETIEQSAERWRANAFEAQEIVSKSFGKDTKGSKYRLTVKDGYMFLERFYINRDGMSSASSWTGLMFPDSAEELYELTSVFVRESKRRNNAGLV